jgi:hypothetical protein
MTQLHTPAEAAEILKIRESWLRGKAAARAIPCTFIQVFSAGLNRSHVA